ncbi:MAG: hypothetical protein E7054_05760 [Lentisphaerae bacterium]|nr:hypothetical protein [Lentisphaerota bacterium]
MAGQAERQIPRFFFEKLYFNSGEITLSCYTTRAATIRRRSASYGGTGRAANTSLFLKKDGGLGEGKNFFSREKKFFPSPKNSSQFAASRSTVPQKLFCGTSLPAGGVGGCRLKRFADISPHSAATSVPPLEHVRVRPGAKDFYFFY